MNRRAWIRGAPGACAHVLRTAMRARVAVALCLSAVACAAVAVGSEPHAPLDLPPAALVERALSEHPSVLAAQAGIAVGQAEQARYRAGPYEYSVRVGAQQRQVTVAPTHRFGEWGVALEKPFRLPAKRRIDGELGQNAVTVSEQAYGDALHEAGRALLALWFAWIREAEQVRQWQKQVEVLQGQLDIVDKRVKAGDAPQLEVVLAQSALAQAKSAFRQAQLREQQAATNLNKRFPQIVLPPKPTLLEPTPPTQDLDYWRQQVLARSHRLALARAEVKRADLSAARAQSDLTPDPTVGIHYDSERGGEERIVGLSLSIPLPGGARRATAHALEAQASMASQREAATLAAVGAETDNLYAGAVAAYQSWQNIQAAAVGMARSADLMSRAYAIGEANLTDVLTARRQAIDARLAATLAQIDAAETHYRLLLDAHQLWRFSREGQAADRLP
ncbi:MAG: TolC family protein [Betaproteobacteria bacterium]|nr:TolC family protein [Betaproteobacteria bacterium]